MLKLQVERDENGKTKVQYTMGAGLEAMRRDAGGGMASGDSSFYHYNHLGTTMALTNAAASVSDTYRHDAWGVRLASTGSTVNPHTYVGRERYYRMPEPNLYHLGFRDYAQRVGRFTTVDPARWGLNWIIYARNLPTGIADPSGLRERPYLIHLLPEWGYARTCYDVGWLLRVPADKMAYITFPEQEIVNTERDAFRHCLWTCLITAVIGPGCAWLVGDGHEMESIFVGAPKRERVMDRHNNAVGRRVGQRLDPCEKKQPLEPCMAGCQNARDSMLWLEPSRHG